MSYFLIMIVHTPAKFKLYKLLLLLLLEQPLTVPWEVVTGLFPFYR